MPASASAAATNQCLNDYCTMESARSAVARLD